MAIMTTIYKCGHHSLEKYGWLESDETINVSMLCPSCRKAEIEAKKANSKIKTYYVVDRVEYFGRSGVRHVTKVVSKVYPHEEWITTIKARNIDEARKLWNEKSLGLQLREAMEIAKKVAPNGDHGSIVDALMENFECNGLIYQRWLNGDNITAKDVYAVVVAHLRHTETDYDNALERGEYARQEYNDHDTAREIMGWE
ncbi:hypothetical protein QB910_000133 [Dabrowskivirus KKP3916]|uniref:Uncharacterized protein n=1 Tax=Alicyclobacillus phage KKP_3916 TaxID=3040651 RepID=A0AAT9V7R3_9CAUD|nr:hypothetical protein QB910_000133 [Alicyclobacillus phage KKP 3916]